VDVVCPESGNCCVRRDVKTTTMYAAAEPRTPKIEIKKTENKTDFFLIEQHPLNESWVS
jgi:hypothetical protein